MAGFGDGARDRGDTRLRLIATAVLAVSALVLAAQLTGAFIGLDRSSFWFDELWTISTITPPTIGGVFLRTAEDVHPPFYFLIGHFWIRAFGLTETSLRLLSALAAVASVLSLLVAGKRFLRFEARLYAGLIGATSICWIDYSQTARMYGLGFLVGTWLALLALHVLDRLTTARPVGAPLLAAFALLCFTYAFMHFYMFLACGDLVALLVLAARRWPDRLALFGIGLAILAPMALYVRFLSAHTLVDVQHTWLTTSLGWLLDQTWQGVRQQIRPEVIAALGMLAAATVVMHRARPKMPWASSRLVQIALMASVPLFLIVCGITMSFLVAPNYSARNLAVAAPFSWLAIGLLIDLCLDHLPARGRLAATMLLLVACLPGVARLPKRWIAKQEEFRGASLYVRDIAACRGQPIPIIRKDTTAILPLGIERVKGLYGYYLQRPAALLPLIDYSSSAVRVSAPSTDALLARRIDGIDPCPVLALMVHAVGATPRYVARDLVSRAHSSKTHVALASFPHVEAGQTITDAFVFLRPPEDRQTASPD